MSFITFQELPNIINSPKVMKDIERHYFSFSTDKQQGKATLAVGHTENKTKRVNTQRRLPLA